MDEATEKKTNPVVEAFREKARTSTSKTTYDILNTIADVIESLELQEIKGE